MSKYRITPISQMWSKARLVFFTDTSGQLCDATGDIVSEDKSSITLGNREGGRLEIPRACILSEEVLNDDKAG